MQHSARTTVAPIIYWVEEWVEWGGGNKNDAAVGFVVAQKAFQVQAFDANV